MTDDPETAATGDRENGGSRTRDALGVEPLPERLDSSPAKLVYLYLRAVTEARLAELRRSLGMRALALYPVLELLIDRGLVERVDDRYVVTAEEET
ncbi:TrmB family transcriptional regulator [Haloplanus halophilus]|uniref:TrmB family transcriptional regulator n=1 Tax=Haloplanus halophilus TaxID=2949993 RepID=UPI0020412937|nr:TrmB family transcriptional regulator [Haloplanus sp. GDY1]